MSHFTERRLVFVVPIKLFILVLLSLFVSTCVRSDYHIKLTRPIVINTWNFTSANARAWKELDAGRSALDAIEQGCGQCEIDRCDGTVGWGGSPSETGETTLDAMIMDGESYNVGAVGGLRRIKNAIGVARLVLDHTEHTLLVGEMATEFALAMGFKEENLTSSESRDIYAKWKHSSACQPNYWRDVVPDPKTSCGPYKLPAASRDHDDLIREIHRVLYAYDDDRDDLDDSIKREKIAGKRTKLIEGHDTVGMVAIDKNSRIASGTSTNGLRHKIQGRVGDSPVPGAGSYAADAGSAAATGDGDVILRFLLSYQAVANLRLGFNAQDSANDVILQLIEHIGTPYPQAAVIVLGKDGSFGAACSGFDTFPYVVSDAHRRGQTFVTKCFK